MKARILVPLALAAGIIAVAQAGQTSQEGHDQDVFARVGTVTISVKDYKDALNRESRARFYHGAAPVEEIEQFQHEVADRLVVTLLAIQEADKRNMPVDEAALAAELQRYLERAARHGQTIDQSGADWKALEQRLGNELRAAALEKQIRESVGEPSPEELQAFYAANPDKFTEPERRRVSDILLSVAPSSPAELWKAAEEEGKKIVARIRAGADFAALARLHSADSFASNGGDMGYLHEGMLSKEVEEALAKLAPGEVSDPILVLEGIGIFRVDAREPGGLMSFEKVRERATGLWRAQVADDRWRQFVDTLRANTKIEIDERYLTPSGKGNEQSDGVEPASPPPEAEHH